MVTYKQLEDADKRIVLKKKIIQVIDEWYKDLVEDWHMFEESDVEDLKKKIMEV